MSRKKRILAFMVGMGLLFVLFASSAYIVHEAGHFCTGAHCQVCQQIEEVRALLHSLALLVLALAVVRTVLSLHRTLLAMNGQCRVFASTLVNWKVRLND